MNEVKIGDSVVVAHFDENRNIELRSSRILAVDVYQHSDHRSPIHYRQIYTTMNGSALHITPSHSLLGRKKHKSYSEYLFAADIDIGDDLYFVNEDNRLTISVRITQINDVILFDAYAPLTLEGNLIVNHFLVSCYGTFTHHLGHWIKMPRRWWLYSSLNYISLLI